MLRILGYDTQEWHEIFIILKVMGNRPTDMFEVLKLWNNIPKGSVADCLKVAAIYAQNTTLDVAEYHDILSNFVKGINNK